MGYICKLINWFAYNLCQKTLFMAPRHQLSQIRCLFKVVNLHLQFVFMRKLPRAYRGTVAGKYGKGIYRPMRIL